MVDELLVEPILFVRQCKYAFRVETAHVVILDEVFDWTYYDTLALEYQFKSPFTVRVRIRDTSYGHLTIIIEVGKPYNLIECYI